MADQEHVEMLLRGADAWNEWRRGKPGLRPDFVLADLEGRAPDLSGAHLYNADFAGARLRGLNFSGANLSDAIFCSAGLGGADLGGADLNNADFTEAELVGANLSGANLSSSRLISTDLRDADLTGCRVYGVAAWNLRLEGAAQTNLTITEAHEPKITTDDLQVAQFIHLMLRNENIRNVIDGITSKAVLILGRFTPERKGVLDAIRAELRGRDRLPILFDFEKPSGKDLTGTVETLARMARFIIVDLTEASSVPHELAAVVPFLRTTPVLPLRLKGAGVYSMFHDLRAYQWVMEPYEYEGGDALIRSLGEVISPAEELSKRLRGA